MGQFSSPLHHSKCYLHETIGGFLHTTSTGFVVAWYIWHCLKFSFHILIFVCNKLQRMLRSAFFWYFTQCKMVVSCRHFGTTCRSHLQGASTSRSHVKNSIVIWCEWLLQWADQSVYASSTGCVCVCVCVCVSNCVCARNCKRCSLDLIGAVALQKRGMHKLDVGYTLSILFVSSFVFSVTSVKRYSEFHNSFATDAVTKTFACVTLSSLTLFLTTLQRLWTDCKLEREIN